MSVTKLEEHKLALLFQQTKDPAIIEFLITQHDGYIWQVINQVNRAFRERLSLPDLYQTAIVGFIDGVNRFDQAKNTRILTYVHFWMMARLFESYAESMPVHIPANILRNMVWRTEKQRAEELNRFHDKIANVVQLQRNTDEAVSDDVIMKETCYRNSADDTYQQYERTAVSQDIREAVNTLPRKWQRLLQLRADGLDRHEIALQMHCSPSEVDNNLRTIRRQLKKQPAIQRAA